MYVYDRDDDDDLLLTVQLDDADSIRAPPLPVVATDNGDADAADSSRCSICLTDELEEPFKLSLCGHKFCTRCLAEWT